MKLSKLLANTLAIVMIVSSLQIKNIYAQTTVKSYNKTSSTHKLREKSRTVENVKTEFLSLLSNDLPTSIDDENFK